MISASGSIFTSLVFSILAAATPADIAIRGDSDLSVGRRQVWTPSMPASMCATELLCCNSVTRADAPGTSQILALLGISGSVRPYDVVGLTCTPISGLGALGSCNAQPVCCWWGAEYAYLVAVDCTPVILGE